MRPILMPEVEVTKAHGKHIWFGKNKCLDYSLGGGTHIFGHGYSKSVATRCFTNGTLYCAPSSIQKSYEKEFLSRTGHESMVFCNTGSEAVMRAFRIARAYTGKKKIAIFEGGWHGSNDCTLGKDYPLGVGSASSDMVVLPTNETKALELLRTHADELAMVFMEPFMGSEPIPRGYLYEIILNFCHKNNILFGFDEIISGFRRQGSEYYQMEPDIATYGKLCGGGFPIGIVAGKRSIIDVIYKGVFMGGTFSGNPVSLTCGLNVIKHIDRNILNGLEYHGMLLRKLCDVVLGTSSINKLYISRKELVKPLIDRIREEGIHIGYNCLMFLSTLHTESDIRRTAKVINDARRNYIK